MDLETETQNLIKKEKQRYEMAVEACKIEVQVYKDRIIADDAAH